MQHPRSPGLTSSAPPTPVLSTPRTPLAAPGRRLSRRTLQSMRTYESADYGSNESSVFFAHQSGLSSRFLLGVTLMRWVLVVVIGLAVGTVGFLMEYVTDRLFVHKAASSTDLVSSRTGVFGLFSAFAAFNLFYCLLATVVTLWAPSAAGSGVAEVKCYLNGCKIVGLFTVRTFLAKAVGVVFSVAGCLVVGKEGPMFHIGALLAHQISQGRFGALALPMRVFGEFRSDKENMDFVAAGTGAGIAAAFGAPVAGLLFALEEGASFVDQALTFRAFLCAAVAAFTRDFLVSGAVYNLWFRLAMTNVLNFGAFTEREHAGYSMKEFPFFVCLGVFGGLVGALLNALARRMIVFGMKHCTGRAAKVLQMTALSVVTSAVLFYVPLFTSRCIDIKDSVGTVYFDWMNQVDCPAGQANDLASIMWNRTEHSIKMLLHSKSEFSIPSLLLASVFYFSLAVLGMGMPAPAGQFVPFIMIGSVYGRLTGKILRDVLGRNVAEGTFALIGAASFIGGTMRMNLAITVMLVETTNDLSWLLPIMIAIVVSKWAGDLFNEGFFDELIHIKNIPFLSHIPDHAASSFMARDVMCSDVVKLQVVEQVGHLLAALRGSAHNGYPVVERSGAADATAVDGAGAAAAPGGTFVGLILRQNLTVLLSRPDLFADSPLQARRPASVLTLEELNKDYPDFPSLEAISARLTPADLARYVSLEPYMNRSPSIVQESASLGTCFTLFHSLGIRHLIVVDHQHQIVGMVTRFDVKRFLGEHGQ